MRIPGFYRRLVARYPNTLCSVVEDHSRLLDGVPSPDTSKPNPNGVEFDNLYIDMNGAIHTCFHYEGTSYDDIFNFIFMYVDRIFSVVRPRKLLYIAVDGVAPRTKMNHQRIKRFRAARETVGKGKRACDKRLDSNVIAPGTEFMDLLSCALNYFVYLRLNGDPGWRGIKVILSDSTVVGEGEDKIMSYIRSQRNLPGYDPNTRHCLHGLDADFIMPALATHEIHVSILREVITNERKYRHKELLCSQCMREFIIDLEFKFFNVWVLREYLEMELLPTVEGTDFDRLIDDFVFMCVFVGNDYLPHFPSLNVSKGGIELLLMVYQQEFVKMGYLTNAPEVNLKSMEHFLQALSSHENIFMKRSQLDMEKNKRKRKGFQDSNDQAKIVESGIISAPNSSPDDGDVEPTTNKVKIHDSYMEQHYTMNFDCKSDDIDRIKRHAVLKYTEGICWIMHSYYQQVPSWQWFYPYHYAPLASDFCGLDKLEINFTLGQPFKPLDHLLGVLPATSAQALPLFYRELMINKSSPIFDFYCKDAETSRQGVCKLPFIDESRLLSEIAKVELTLTDEEKQRNMFGRDMLFVHSSHPLAETIKDLPSSDPSSDVQIQIRPDLSDGMNGYLCISDKHVFPSNMPSPFVDKPAVEMNSVKSVDFKCPSHAHIPKLLCGVIMPPRILRPQDRPRSRVAWHAKPSQSAFQSERSTKKRTQDDKSCILGDATEAGYCMDERKQQNAINVKSEVELQNHLIAGKSTNQTEAQQQFKAGNGGMNDGTQRDDKQAKGTEDEKLINTGVCEKPFTSGDGEHESPGGKPKRKRKNKKQKQLDAQQQVDLVDRGGEAKELDAKGEVPQGTNITINSVEDPTICERPSTIGDGEHESLGGETKRKQENEKPNAQQKVDLVDKGAEAKEHEAKGEVPEGVKIKVNSVEASGICDKPSTLGDKEHESLGGEPKRKQKKKKKLEAQQQVDLANSGAEEHEAKGEVSQMINITVNSVKEPTNCEKPFTGAEAEGEVPQGIKNTINCVAESTISEKPFTVDGEHGSLGGEPKRQQQKKLEPQQEVDFVDKEFEAEKQETGGEMLHGITNMVNSVEDSTFRTKRRRVQDEAVLINGGAGGNKKESPAAAEAVTNVEVGGENLTDKMDSVGGDEPIDLVGDENMKAKRKKVKGGDVVIESDILAVSTEQEKEHSNKRKKHKSKLGGEVEHVIEPQTKSGSGSKNVEEHEAAENEDDGGKRQSKKRRRKRQPTQEVAATEESDLLSSKE